ncbi:MAG: hypothetical protein HKN20_05895 [Gemmatimonadetes bacterium]|nr:hypothetical protein [Gemmatimonadota bacterium]
METWQSVSALARPVPIKPDWIRSRGHRAARAHADDFEKRIRRALFSSANVLLYGDTDQAESYLRSILETRLVTMNGGEDTPEHLAGVARGIATTGITTVLVKNVDRMRMNEQFGLLDLLECDASRSAVPCGFRLISTTKNDLERATARAAFLPSLLLRIGTISLRVPTDFFEVMSNRHGRFSLTENMLSTRWEGARA